MMESWGFHDECLGMSQAIQHTSVKSADYPLQMEATQTGGWLAGTVHLQYIAIPADPGPALMRGNFPAFGLKIP